MTAPEERAGEAPGGALRIWEKGAGDPVGYFAGLQGLPKWLPFLDLVAAHHRVAAPSLPGFPGGHTDEAMDSHLDWVLAAGDAFKTAGLAGSDLIGASAGGALAAEVAATWPEAVRRLVLIAPFGVFDEAEPLADVFAQKPGQTSALLSDKPEELDAWLAPPDGEDALEWDIVNVRATNAAARYLWPLGDTRLIKRLGRITCPTLLIRGANDRVIPESYAQRFADAITGEAIIKTIPSAGHMAEFDAPEAVAEAVLSFLS